MSQRPNLKTQRPNAMDRPPMMGLGPTSECEAEYIYDGDPNQTFGVNYARGTGHTGAHGGKFAGATERPTVAPTISHYG